jgi:hypothetical protein
MARLDLLSGRRIHVLPRVEQKAILGSRLADRTSVTQIFECVNFLFQENCGIVRRAGGKRLVQSSSAHMIANFSRDRFLAFRNPFSSCSLKSITPLNQYQSIIQTSIPRLDAVSISRSAPPLRLHGSNPTADTWERDDRGRGASSFLNLRTPSNLFKSLIHEWGRVSSGIVIGNNLKLFVPQRNAGINGARSFSSAKYASASPGSTARTSA